VEQVAEVSRQGGSLCTEASPGSEQGISDEWMSRRGKMNADLVRPAGFNSNLDEGSVSAPFEDSDAA